MKPPEDDLDARRPVWDAMQMLYMDVDPADWIAAVARVAAASAYSLEELERILVDEVKPACPSAWSGPAPEWRGYEIDELVRRILEKHRFGRRRPFLGRRADRELWRLLEVELRRRRDGGDAS